jgi:signal transduction histidine kinase/CheY-like chemotaxis protein
LAIVADDDVFTMRQRGRDVAAELGFDEGDQVRIAAALSEVGREALAGQGGSATFLLDEEIPALTVVVHRSQAAMSAGSAVPRGVAAAARLMDDVATEGNVVTLCKRLPAQRWEGDLDDVRSRIAAIWHASPFDVLRAQNLELVEAMEKLTRLNVELEDTNRGVLALYAELDGKSALLQEASDAKSRFLASVSHELRTPVNSVLGLCRFLLEPDSDTLTGDQRHEIELIMASASDLLGLVNELLDLAKAESGRLDPAIAPVELSSLFGELRGAMGPLAHDGVELVVETPGVRWLDTDRVLLGQVLRNLLTNALKYTTVGTVTLQAHLSPAGDQVQLVVRDTGIGIAPEDQRRVFEEFYQVRNALQVHRRGTGLGLPYARRASEALGGTLELSSEPGRGSTFVVSLPACGQPAPGGAGPGGAGPGGAGPGPGDPAAGVARFGTAMVVDDDASFRHVMRAMLQGLADHVVEAGDGSSALDMIMVSPPDVIFLDLRMPGTDGTEVIDRMNKEPALRDVPIIIVTSVNIDNALEARAGRARAVLAKTGLTREDLLETLSGIAR